MYKNMYKNMYKKFLSDSENILSETLNPAFLVFGFWLNFSNASEVFYNMFLSTFILNVGLRI